MLAVYTAPETSEIDEDHVRCALNYLISIEPNTTLEQMQLDYYGFTNDPRYLVSPEVSSIVCGALNEAWHGISQWQR
jgi:hypothetical protein